MSDSLQPYGLLIARLLSPWDSSGKKTGVGCHALLQGIFLTQGSKLCLLLSQWGRPSQQVQSHEAGMEEAVRDKKAGSCSLCKYITILTLHYSCNSCVSDSRCLVKLLSHVRLCNPMDGSLPGSSIHGIFQARVLEWGAIALSVGLGTLLYGEPGKNKMVVHRQTSTSYLLQSVYKTQDICKRFTHFIKFNSGQNPI